MTLAALVDAGADLAAIQSGIDSLGLPTCRLVRTEVKKQGFRATQITIEHEPEHKHRHLHHIVTMIDGSTISARAKDWATRIFRRLAEAEALVHGTTVEKVHFHEVGAVDSIADIVGSSIAFDLLGIEDVVCSPVPTGHGFVEIAHGRCSIPAPATAQLLRGVPLVSIDVDWELTTPTGAAILAALVKIYGPLPSMIVDRIGTGAGQRDLEHPNILRVLVGDAGFPISRQTDASLSREPRIERIVLLETNLDDATGESVSHAVDQLWAAGALDVALTPIQMKKGRPGVLLSVQTRPPDADNLERIIFRETTTLGVRRANLIRTALARQETSVETEFGSVAGKIAFLPDGSARFMPEYESARRIAESRSLPLQVVVTAAQQAFPTSAAGAKNAR